MKGGGGGGGIDLYTEQATMEAGRLSISWSHAFTDVSFY